MNVLYGLTGKIFGKKTTVMKADDPNAVNIAAAIMKKGGLIIYPTETSYGIGADYTNKKAVRKIHRLKQRPSEKKIPVVASGIRMMKKYAVITRDAEKLAKKFMPGPLTLVVNTKKGGTVAFRISSHPFAKKLPEKLGKPVTSTSANISGNKPLYKFTEVLAYFLNKADLIVDGGNLKKTKPSTIFDVENKCIIRKGTVKLREIKSELK
jgi:L-threonylcarbamoyladenylate synthase